MNFNQDSGCIDISNCFPEESQQLYSNYQVQFTGKIWELVENAVASQKYNDDYKAIVWHILWSSQADVIKKPTEDQAFFNATLPGNAHETYVLKAVKSSNPKGKPHFTVSCMNER